MADGSRPTTTKTRVVAHSQQVVRIDDERPGDLSAEVEAELIAAVPAELEGVKGCVVSDYGKGVVTAGLARAVVAAATAAGVPVVIDPKGTDYAKYRGATLVKPNQLEAGQVLNRPLKTDDDVTRAGADLLELLHPSAAVLVTRGAAGMSLFERGQEPVHVPAQAREVYDVTGAGDTVAGVLATGPGVRREACPMRAGWPASPRRWWWVKLAPPFARWKNSGRRCRWRSGRVRHFRAPEHAAPTGERLEHLERLAVGILSHSTVASSPSISPRACIASGVAAFVAAATPAVSTSAASVSFPSRASACPHMRKAGMYGAAGFECDQ